MSKFIRIQDKEGGLHYINTNHIISVFRYNISETNISMSNGNIVITDLDINSVMKKIED